MLKSDRILALDIGTSGIKIAEFAGLNSGGLSLVNFAVGSIGLDYESDSDRAVYLVTTIRDLMREKGIKPGPVLISIAGQSVFSRFVRLPPVDVDKVYQIILYEAQQNVPFPMEELVWDYQLIGRAEGELDVMLAAIKAQIIEGLTDCVKASGLDPDLVDVAPMALYNAVRYNYEDLTGCVLLIDIGARSTDLIFLEEGRIFCRSIPVAGNAITQQIAREFEMSLDDAEELKRAHAFVAFGGAYEGPSSDVADKVSKSVRSVMTRMHAEVNRSISFYRSQQNGSKPSRILLSGGTSVIPYTDTFLSEKLNVSVEYINPFRNIAVDESISAEEIGNSAHLLAETVGLALRRFLSCPIELNLMPQNVLDDKEFRKKQPFLLAAAVALVLILAMWSVHLFKMTNLAKTRLASVSDKVTVLERLEKRLRTTEAQNTTIQDKMHDLLTRIDSRSIWLKILDRISSNLQDGMWLTSVRPVIEQIKPDEEENSIPVDPNDSPVTGITKIEISGRGYIDKIRSAEPIRIFRDKLRDEVEVSEKTNINWQPAPGKGDITREFKIMIVLEEPLVL